jgi:hypothetical protein
MIDLFAGAALMISLVLLYLVLHWGARKPEEPSWMREALVANPYTPFLVGTLAFGLSYLVKFALVSPGTIVFIQIQQLGELFCDA